MDSSLSLLYASSCHAGKNFKQVIDQRIPSKVWPCHSVSIFLQAEEIKVAIKDLSSKARVCGWVMLDLVSRCAFRDHGSRFVMYSFCMVVFCKKVSPTSSEMTSLHPILTP